MRNTDINVSYFDALGEMMHKAILSDKERMIIKHFLESSKKLQGFRMLKVRIKRNHKRIVEDFELIQKVFEKFQN